MVARSKKPKASAQKTRKTQAKAKKQAHRTAATGKKQQSKKSSSKGNRSAQSRKVVKEKKPLDKRKRSKKECDGPKKTQVKWQERMKIGFDSKVGHKSPCAADMRKRRMLDRQRKEDRESVQLKQLAARKASAQRRAIVAVKRKEHALAPILRLPNEMMFQLISGVLDHKTLIALDATCRSFRKCNHAVGAWRAIGSKCFRGLDLFDDQISFTDANRKGKSGWKKEYFAWAQAVLTFRPPYNYTFADANDLHGIIRYIDDDDVVVRTQFRLRGEELAMSDQTIYLEISVTANCDNLSLALDDFDYGGKSSLTFSPDTGCIIKETKIQEWPRRVEGSYMQVLPYAANQKFRGKVALCVKHGMISFYRKPQGGIWECTGLCSDFTWAKEMKASPGMAFRDRGKYTTTITKVDNTPPFEPNFNQAAFESGSWSEINWYDTEDED